MNILFLTEYPVIPSKGGIERVTSILSDIFRLEGNQVFCIDITMIRDSDDFCKKIADCQIDIIIAQGVIPEILDLLESAKDKVRVIFTVLHNRPFSLIGQEREVKHALTPATLKGFFLKWITIVSPLPYRYAMTRHERKLYHRAASVSDRLLLLSERYIPRLLYFAPEIPSQKVGAINNPSTLIPVNYDSLSKENLIIWVGRLTEPQKNVKSFIDFWNIFRQTYPDWKAEIIGDGPDRKKLEKYAMRHKTQSLSFIGMTEDVDSYYRRAKFIVMTSRYEGWPMVLGEAMGAGCIPAVFHSFEAVDDIVTSGENGIISEKCTPRELAEKVAKTASDTQKMLTMASEAQKASERFSIKNIITEWNNLIHDIGCK